MLHDEQKMFAHVDKNLLHMPLPDFAKFKNGLDRVKNYQSLKEIIHLESDNLFKGPKQIFKLRRNQPAGNDACDTSEKSVVTTSSRQVTINH